MSKKILLVEDQALIAMSEAKLLKTYGYDVVIAYSGEDSIAAVETDPEISLLLMDIDLGQGMDGTEAAQRILKTHDLPIVFLTSHSEKEYVDRVKKITGYGYVLKNSGKFVIRESIQMAFQLFDSRKKLQDKEEQLKLAMDAEDHGYWDWNLDTNEAYFSPKYCEMLGYEANELPGDYRTWEKLLHPEDKEYAKETVQEKLKRGEAFELEFRMLTKSGNWKWIKGKGNLYYIDKSGVPHRFVGTHEDITERKHAEQQLKLREQNLHTTLNSIGDAVVATDSRGNVIRMNPVAERLCGWSIEEAEGRPLEEVFHIVNAHTRQPLETPVKRVMETGNIVGLANHTLLISKMGDEYQIADSAAPIQGDSGEIRGVVLVFRNVTEEYRKNRQIRESKEFLDAVFLSIQDGISVLDTDLSITYVNPVMERWYASNMPLIGSHCYSAYHNRDTPCEPCPSLRCMKTGRTETDIVTVEEDINSPVKWVELFSYPLVDEETGKIKGVIEFVRDISDRRRAEKRLEESEARWQFALEGAGDGVWDWNAETDKVFFSRQWKNMLGYNEDEIGDTLFEWESRIHPEDKESCFADLEAHLSGKTPFYKNEHRMRCKSGEYKWILDRGKVIEWSQEGKPLRVIGTHADISERKNNESQLQKALEEKDFLMRELNHRVKNNIAMVSSLISLKNSEIEADLSDLKKRIEVISLVHEKLHQHNEVDRIEVKDYFQELLESVFYFTADRDVHIVNDIEQARIHTKTAMPLGLLVNEIATNAIKYGFTPGEEARFTVSLNRDEKNRQYILSLSNTGNPFPEEIELEHPETLGLQLVSTLVQQIKGTIDLQKQPYPVFTIRFPIENHR
ncbi:MAG: PAS domain S-box protein [Desulfosalsimonadaceae bacterium]